MSYDEVTYRDAMYLKYVGLSQQNKLYYMQFGCKLKGFSIICELTLFQVLSDLNDLENDLRGQSQTTKKCRPWLVEQIIYYAFFM